MMIFWKPQIVYGGGDEGGGGGGSDKTYDSLSDAAKDGQHGNAVNIKGKGRQKVEFADKSYNKRMATVSANAGGGGGSVSQAARNVAKTVSTAGGRGPDGRYEPIPGPGTIAQRIKGSFAGTDSFHRPASNFKTINNSQRQALEAAGYSVTKQGTVKSRDGSATVAGSRWSRSPQVNQIMAENAEDRASVRSGGSTTPAPVVPKKIVRPQLRPANLTAPKPAPPLDYDRLYTGDPGMTGDPGIFTSPYQVGPRPSTYSPSTFPGGGDPMLADRPSYAGDPYAGDRVPSLPPQLGGRGAEVSGGGGVSDDDVYRRAPSASEYLQEQRLLDSFPDGGQDTFIDDESYETAAFGDTGFGKFLNDYVLGDKTQLETTSGGGVASLPISPSGGGRGNVVEALGDRAAYTPPTQNAPEGVLSFMNPVGRVATEGEKAAGLDKKGSTTLFEAGAYNIPRMGIGALQAFSDLVEEGLASWQDWDRYSKANEDGSSTFKTKINSFDEFGDPVRAEVTIPTPGRSEFSKSLDPYAGAARERAEAALARVNPKWRESLASGEMGVDSVLAKVAYAGAPALATLATAVVNPVAAMVAGGSMAAGSAENQVGDIIDGMVADGSLQNNPQYQAEIKAGKTPEAAVGSIKAQLNRQIVPAVTVIGGAGNAATGFLINQAKSKIGQQLITQSAVPTLTRAAALGAGEEIIQEVAEDNATALLSQVGGKQVKSTPTAKENLLTASVAGILGTQAAIPAIPSALTRDPGQAAVDIDAVGTSPYTAIAAPETTVPVAQIAPPQAAADVISGKPIITPAPEPVVQLEGIPGQNAVSSLATPPPVVPGPVIAPEVLALPSPTGQVPSVRSPAEFANLQNQRGFDPSQVDTSGAQAAAITPDDIGTDPIDMEGADAAARERLASELLQRGTIPNPNALADQLAAQAARNAATADGLETAPVEAAAQGTLPGLDIDDGSNRQSIGAARVDDTTRLIDENAELADIFKRAETEAAALDDGLALDTLNLSGKMFTGGVPTNFETTNLSRFSPLADQIYTTSQRADMQRANQLDMALRARRLAEEAAQAPQNRAQAALDALDQGGPDKSAVEQVNEAREATKLYREYIDTKARTDALNNAMRTGLGNFFNPDGSVSPTTTPPAAEITAPEAVSTSGIVPPIDAAAVADQVAGSSEAGLDAGLSEDAAMAEIMRNFDTNIPLTETVQERVARQLESQRRRQEGQIPARNFDTNIPRPGTDTPAQQIARQLENQRRRQEGQIPDRNFLTDLPRPGTDTPAQQIARQLENQRRRQQSQLDGIGSLATVPPKTAPLEGEILDNLGPFSRGEVPPTGETIEGVAVDLNQVPSPMGRADMDPFLYEGEVIDPVQTTDLTEAKAPVVDTIEGTIIDQTRRQQGQLGGIGSLDAAKKPVVRTPTFIDSEVLSPTGGTPYFPELPTDDVLPPEEREGGGPGGDGRPDVVPPMQTVDGEDGGCPPGYRRVLDPATGRYICLKIEEGFAGAPAAPAEEAEEEEDGVVIDIPVTERPKISPYYVPEIIESNYTPYVPGRRASTQ